MSTFITESLQLEAKQPYGYQEPPLPPAPRPSSRDWKFNFSGPATCLPCDDPNQTNYEPPPPQFPQSGGYWEAGGSSYQKTRAEIDADEIFSDSTKPSEPTSAEERAELKYLRARVQTLEAELAEARSAGGVDRVVYAQEEVRKDKDKDARGRAHLVIDPCNRSRQLTFALHTHHDASH